MHLTWILAVLLPLRQDGVLGDFTSDTQEGNDDYTEFAAQNIIRTYDGSGMYNRVTRLLRYRSPAFDPHAVL